MAYDKKYPGAVICEGAVIRAGAVIREGAVIRASAVIREGAVIGEGADIGEDADIHEGAVIGEGAVIHEGAVICAGAVIERSAVIHANHHVAKCITVGGGYRYQATAYWELKSGKPFVNLGCYSRTIEKWEKDFNNNPKEFPVNSPEWADRKAVYEYCKNWLEIHKPTKEG